MFYICNKNKKILSKPKEITCKKGQQNATKYKTYI